MLGKLLKYDIPMLGRKLFPLYIGWIATAALLGLSVGFLEGRSEFMIVLSGILYTAAATAVVVMALVMIVQRFNNSLFGDGGYFSHVLPVTVSEHIASKLISAVLWVFVSGVAMVITGLIIAVFSGHFLDIFRIDWANLLYEIDFPGVLTIIELLILSVLESAKTILAIYAAITVGHQASSHTVMASIAAYFGVLTLESFVNRIVIGIFGGWMNILDGNVNMNLILLVGMVVTIIVGAVYFFICKYLMENRLNLN